MDAIDGAILGFGAAVLGTVSGFGLMYLGLRLRGQRGGAE